GGRVSGRVAAADAPGRIHARQQPESERQRQHDGQRGQRPAQRQAPAKRARLDDQRQADVDGKRKRDRYQGGGQRQPGGLADDEDVQVARRQPQRPQGGIVAPALQPQRQQRADERDGGDQADQRR